MIEILNRVENKKLGRKVVYFSDNTVTLMENGERIREHVPRAEGHDWIHGTEVPKRPETEEVDVDKMIEVIGARLKEEAAHYMEWGLSSEDALKGMYQAVRSGRSLTRAYW